MKRRGRVFGLRVSKSPPPPRSIEKGVKTISSVRSLVDHSELPTYHVNLVGLQNRRAFYTRAGTFQEREKKIMSSVAQTLADLQAPMDTLIAGHPNLKSSVDALRAAGEAAGRALAMLEAGDQRRISPEAAEAARAQLDAASSAVRSAKTEVKIVLIDLTGRLSTALFRSGITVVVSPSTATLGHCAMKQFLAFGDSVIWSLNPATGEGTIDQTGLYIAPSEDGTVQVIATSTSNSARAGFARVTIRGDIPPRVTPRVTQPRARLVE
jgi:hypothetical protein